MISIIIPNYNHYDYLEERLDSVFSQTYLNYEVIILDDCSTDNSLKILSRYKDHPKVSHFIVNKVNSGSVFKQWNKGIELAQGELIWIAESDDIASYDFLEKMVHSFDKYAKVVLAYCQSKKINSSGEIFGDWVAHTDLNGQNKHTDDFHMGGGEFIEKYMLDQNSIPNASGVIFKKSIYQLVGGPLTELRTVGDWNVWVKILTQGEIFFCAEKMNFFRMHDSSCVALSNKNDKRANIILMHLNMYENLFDFFHKNNFKISQKKWEKRDMVATKLMFNCISNNNYQLLFEVFIKYKLFYIFFNRTFYFVFLRMITTFFLGKSNGKI
ncbi:glycosyltransferase [Acinetobacter wuhouensis]|uniref:glycosyltransferase family 2 protein n=1 Tax=Acinetobacter wuhouensis TaxID=1879050 RepID=UPI00083B9CE6|nr:glycosyltransferase family 2 protein [Acinetobacter wuhouensis]AXQ20982.1 glycosyltransferase [Acinetobacter wuhouensis]